MSKTFNPNLVKIHWSYSVEEVATLLNIHKNTVRNWFKTGLKTIDNFKPALILGYVLKQFLKDMRKANKKPCKPDEIYCVKCRKPKKPLGGMVDYIPRNEVTGRLIGLCPDCNSTLNKFVNKDKLLQLGNKLDVFYPQDQKHIFDTPKPLVNSNFI